jgi:hypothetical protein
VGVGLKVSTMDGAEPTLRFDGRVAVVNAAGRGVARADAVLLVSRGDRRQRLCEWLLGSV